MKVLFAVNNESISDDIIKKYQKDYREILSYKNVYYFNAILKEIQKDKSYDRIVISEDLEPFAKNNYASIDKTIFEKLDMISDEAHDEQGNEISIILICSDRHTKQSSFLVKIFGIGVYNALLGSDRRKDEVCRLINKPRTKKEAKMYYKIDTDDVNYRAENENEVSELEIQNIISHFKKLGKNVEKYCDSFDSIASQYTDEQIKIIINCLPITVKAILEENSAKYQEIMSVDASLISVTKTPRAVARQDQKRTGIKIDIIENKLHQNKMTQPIVIPNSVKANKSTKPKRVVAVSNDSSSDSQKPVQAKRVQPSKVVRTKDTNSQSVNNETEKRRRVAPTENQENGKVVRKKVARKPIEEEENIQPKRAVKPVRKVKSAQGENIPNTANRVVKEKIENRPVQKISNDVAEDEPVQNSEPVKKKRGRPRKNPVETEVKPKGKRGRPRKTPIPEPVVEEDDELDLLNNVDEIEIPDLMFEDENIENNDNVLGQEDDFDNNDQLSGLDELDDFERDENLEEVFDEFDEFNDYDEYGEFHSLKKPKNDIQELYQESVIEDDNLNFDTDDFDDTEDDDFGIDNIDSIDDLDDVDEDNLLSDLDEEDNFDSMDFEEDEEDNLLSDDNLDFNEEYSEDILGEEDDLYEEDSYQEQEDYGVSNNAIESIQSPIDYSMSNLNSLMTKENKIVTFIGTTKSGVSFLVNNLAEIFAAVGINTAILDMTKNRNSYYIYTENEEQLRKIAYSSMENLKKGKSQGIRVKQNLTVYTALPNDGKDYSNAEEILSTLVQNHSLILIDCDFSTSPSYFAHAQEIYLVQSMDVLTIQPLTEFLKDLKYKGVLEPEKIRIVINKDVKVKELTPKRLIAGMSTYNNPSMSSMTELFNKTDVKYCSIPFEEMVYSKYLEAMTTCKISLNGYSKHFRDKLQKLGDLVYPLTSKQTYGKSNSSKAYAQNNFSNSMNSTLKKMKKKY